MTQAIEVPYNQLREETLLAVIEEFVTRDGTDYGAVEVPLSTKIEQVKKALLRGDARIMYDTETESCTIVAREMAVA